MCLHRKYLRDQEREQLSEHAADMGLQCARATFRRLFKAQTPVSGTRRLYFLTDLYEAHADRPRDRADRGPRIAQLLEDTYRLFRGGKVSGSFSLIRTNGPPFYFVFGECCR